MGQQRQHMDAAGCHMSFSGLISMFVFDVLQILAGDSRFAVGLVHYTHLHPPDYWPGSNFSVSQITHSPSIATPLCTYSSTANQCSTCMTPNFCAHSCKYVHLKSCICIHPNTCPSPVCSISLVNAQSANPELTPLSLFIFP